MAFIPVSIVYPLHGVLNKDNHVVFAETCALVRYLSCEDILPDDKDVARGAALASAESKVQCFEKRDHQLYLRTVTGHGGSRLARAWKVEDVGVLRSGGPNAPDVRLAKVTFEAKILKKLETQEESALYEALLAQEAVRLNVLIDDLVEAPLILKPHITIYGDNASRQLQSTIGTQQP